VAARHAHQASAGLEHDRGQELIDRGCIREQVLDRVLGSVAAGRHVDDGLGPAIPVLAVVVDDALPDGRVGGTLVGGEHGGVDVQARRIDVLAEQLVGEHARGLGHVGRVHAGSRGGAYRSPSASAARYCVSVRKPASSMRCRM